MPRAARADDDVPELRSQQSFLVTLAAQPIPLLEGPGVSILLIVLAIAGMLLARQPTT